MTSRREYRAAEIVAAIPSMSELKYDAGARNLKGFYTNLYVPGTGSGIGSIFNL